MSEGNSNYITSAQATISDTQVRAAEDNRISRDIMTPHALVTGGTGDPDQRRMYTTTLQGQILVQYGMNGWQAGGLAINTQPTTYQGGLSMLGQNSSASLWGQTMLTGGIKPFLKTAPGAPTCGSSGSPSHQELWCPVPGSGWNVPPEWPGVKHDACGSGSWGGGGGSGSTSTLTPLVYQTSDPPPPNAPYSFTATKMDSNTIQVVWITGEIFEDHYTYDHPDTIGTFAVPTGYSYLIKVATSNTGPFSPVTSLDLWFNGIETAGVFHLNTNGLQVVGSNFPGHIYMYYNYLFNPIAGQTYYFTVQSQTPSGGSPVSGTASVTM